MTYMEMCIDYLLRAIYNIYNVFPVQSTLYYIYMTFYKVAVVQMVEALCFKPEGRGFDSRWCNWKFSLT
jgi:hypothetical protein